MKKIYKLALFLTGFFTIIVFNLSSLQAGLIEPTRSLKAKKKEAG